VKTIGGVALNGFASGCDVFSPLHVRRGYGDGGMHQWLNQGFAYSRRSGVGTHRGHRLPVLLVPPNGWRRSLRRTHQNARCSQPARQRIVTDMPRITPYHPSASAGAATATSPERRSEVKSFRDHLRCRG
jgi:hypothetical protein